MAEYIVNVSEEIRDDGSQEILNKKPLVRCKDCKHWYHLTKTCNNADGVCCQSYVADDWFCADGEKRNEE